MKKRTFSNNQIMAALFVCFLIAVVIIIVSSKKQGSEAPVLDPGLTAAGQETTPPATAPAAQPSPVRTLLGGPKIKLGDVIETAKSWMPDLALYRGKPAPELTLTDIKGTSYALSNYLGRPVLVLIWTPKGSSKLQMQELVALQESGAAPDLQILGLCYQSSMPLINDESIQQFSLENPNITFPLCVARMDAVPSPYNQVDSVPCSFFITPEGRIKLTAMGLVPLDDIKSILAAQ